MSGPIAALREITERILRKEGELRREILFRNVAVSLAIGGPLGIVGLYIPTYLTWRKFNMAPIMVPVGLLALAATIVGVFMLYAILVGFQDLEPGRPATRNPRRSIAELRLELALLQEERRLNAANFVAELKFTRSSYRQEISADLSGYRRESKYYRRIHNIFQSVVIVGSIGSSALAASSVEVEALRWTTVVVTFLVGISAGFTGYFKFRERSFYLQQTADAIEHEVNCADLGIERYANEDVDRNLRVLVEEVEKLKVEQRNREQNLDQPHQAGEGTESQVTG